MTISEIQNALEEWHEANFPDATPEDMLIGVAEEVGELAHANLKRRQLQMPELIEKEKDAVGDIVLFLMNYCNLMGWDIRELTEKTWEEVRERDYQQVRAVYRAAEEEKL